MLHRIALVVALAAFTSGMAWKVSAWFRHSIGPTGDRFSASKRIAAAGRGLVLTLFSRKVLTLIKVFFLDVVLQRPVLREDFLRWLMHVSIYGGFMFLLLVHAFDSYLVAPLYPDYASSLNPFLFLRELGGALILFGLVFAIYRRFIRKIRRPRTSLMDINAMVMVGVIVFSGFFLEATKITSNSSFQEMAQEYTTQADNEDIRALESYWVENFGLVSPAVHGPFNAATLEKGKAMHDMNCRQCHADPAWGFVGFAMSAAMRPISPLADRAGLPGILTWIHYLAALLFLAYLPFSKMFHMFAGPLSLMINAVMRSDADPANVATRQMIELDACTHCGTCTFRCSLAVAVNEIPNLNILPSEKISSLKRLAFGAKLDKRELRTLQQGVVLCTNCNRCSIACPVGIRLRDLWFSARERLLENSTEAFQLLSPLAYYRGLQRERIDEESYRKPVDLALDGIIVKHAGQGAPLRVGEKELLGSLRSSIQANSLSNCYRCGVCTNSCPVVRNYRHPGEVLGLLPHQMMHAVGLRCWDLVFGSKMLWDCLGCYQCQDNCPQCVSVTDIMYELKNRAISRKYQEMDI